MNIDDLEIDQLVPRLIEDPEFLQLMISQFPESERGKFLDVIGNELLERFELTGSIDDLVYAIAIEEKALDVTPNNSPYRAEILGNLGNAFLTRFERLGSMEDLDCAIEKSEKALDLTPPDHLDYATYLDNLGNAFQSRFERTGSLADLDSAIAKNEKAVELTPLDHPNCAMYVSNLGCALQNRFERTGSMEDIHRAIEKNEKAVELTPLGHPDRAGMLNNVGMALQKRFQRTGSIADLDRAIETNGQAVESTPLNHPDLAMYLNNLGNALQYRFKWIGSVEDVGRAIEAHESAVELTPLDHPDRPMYLNNLGTAFQGRFERTGSMDDLRYAIETSEKAVESCPVDHPDCALYLNSLGVALQRRFEKTRAMHDLDRAIKTNDKAAELMPLDHPRYVDMLNNLGIALLERSENTGSTVDLNRAIKTKETAVQLTPMDHPDRAIYLLNFGNALRRQFERTKSMDVFERSIAIYEQSTNSDIAPPSLRLSAAQACADLLISQRMLKRAKPILETAVNLLPSLSLRQLKREDAQFSISQFANLTARAVSLCLESNMYDPYRALQLLELGRGILANLQLEVRSDISVLGAEHPELAQQFQHLRDEIDCPLRTLESGLIEHQSTDINSASNASTNRRKLLQQFDSLLVQIRSLQGFEDFLKGPSETQMRSLAAGGAIVVFNVSDIRSDAFLITPNGIRSVPLPLLTVDSLKRLGILFLEAIYENDPNRYRHRTRDVNSVLQGLWNCGVKTALDELGFSRTPAPGQPWPRVWWVGSGLLSVFPIHAAGYHDSGSLETVLDRAISSYAFTVKSLAYARERRAKAGQDGRSPGTSSILFGMPTTPDEKSLPFVETEINEIKNLLNKAAIPTVVKLHPDRAQTLSTLPEHHIVHFACHGYSAYDPSESSLLLQDWKTTPLTVSDLVSLNVESAQFAYLSACHSSAMKDLRLLDESINLSSAIQLCGYPCVVGTLWQVGDRSSVEVANCVYQWILEGDDEFDAGRSAEGLHRAVRQLRERTRILRRHEPFSWAPFIHVGI